MSISVTNTNGNSVSVTVNGQSTALVTTQQSSVTIAASSQNSVTVTNKGPKGDTGAQGPQGDTGANGGTDIVLDTTPQLGGDLDVNGNKIVSVGGGDIRIEPSTSGDIVLRPVSGKVSLQCQTGVEIDGKSFPASIKFLEADTQSPRHSISFFTPNTWDSHIVFTLPSADGSDGQVLKTNGSGVLSFVNQTTDTNTQLSAEEVQDIVGAMFTGNTETRISVTYQDADGTIDLEVDSIPVDLTSDGAGTIHANNVPTLNQSTTGNAATATALATARAINGVNFDGTAAITVTAAGSTLSDTVPVSKGGTGLTTAASNSLLTGNGTSAFTAEANLAFSADRLTIGGSDEITPILRLINDENTVHIAIADSADDLLTGVSDGDLLIESVGDHSVMIGSNDVIAIDVNSRGAKIENRRFEVTSSTDGDHQGDVVYIGSTTSMTTGALYHYKSDGTWELADADAASTCDGLLGIALGAASNTNGVLLRGMVTIDHDPGAVGDVLFVSTTAGDITATAPSGNGDIVRVVGYCLDASNGQIWFNPDGAFVEVSA